MTQPVAPTCCPPADCCETPVYGGVSVGEGIVLDDGAAHMAGETVWADPSSAPMMTTDPTLSAPLEAPSGGAPTIVEAAPVAPVADPAASQPVSKGEAVAAKKVDTEAAESDQALKRAKTQAKKARETAAAAREEAEAAVAAKTAAQEQVKKLRAQNANLKKNLETARARIEKMQENAANQKAKREDRPVVKAANDGKKPDGKKPGGGKPANKKSNAVKATNERPAAKPKKNGGNDEA